MDKRERRSFPDAFKREGIALVASSGRSIGSVAKELGVRDSVLRRWVEKLGTGRASAAAPQSPAQARCRRPTRLPRSLACSARMNGCGWNATF
jgi:transposase-like protein